MAVREIPTTFKTSDGEAYKTKAEAEQHETLIAAQREYESARIKFGRLLAETQMTADGKRFTFETFRRYWHVTTGWSGLPALSEVRLSPYNSDFDFDSRDHFIIRQEEDCGNQVRRTEFRVNELYADFKQAEKALLVAQERWLAQQSEKVEETRAAVSKASA